MSRRRIPLAIWLFALPFVLLGLAAAVLAGWQVAQHLQSLSWNSVPATLETLGSANAARRSTSRIAGRYRYQFDGVEHVGDRLSFSLASDSNFDDWQEQVRNHVGAPGDTFEAWVDPHNPADSVALRAVRWGEVGLLLLSAVIFSGGGMALLGAAAQKGRSRAPGVSWPLIGCMWLIAPLGGMLAWLLWMDSMPWWAALALLPLLLAVQGTIAGVRQRIRLAAHGVQQAHHSGKNNEQ